VTQTIAEIVRQRIAEHIWYECGHEKQGVEHDMDMIARHYWDGKEWKEDTALWHTSQLETRTEDIISHAIAIGITTEAAIQEEIAKKTRLRQEAWAFRWKDTPWYDLMFAFEVAKKDVGYMLAYFKKWYEDEFAGATMRGYCEAALADAREQGLIEEEK
jgi:hypothetical protein